MKALLLVGISSLLLASPAMSATYYLDSFATGEAEATDITQDTPVSLSGGGEGATFTGSATNVGGGSASAYASEGISDVPDYNNSAGSHYYGLGGDVDVAVHYTMRVSGPVTGALVPVRITMTASAPSLEVPPPVGGPQGYYAPVIAGAGAAVDLSYSEVGVPGGATVDDNNGDIAGVFASTSYDYRHFLNGFVDGVGDPDVYPAPELQSNSETFDEEVMVAANFDILVVVDASAGVQFTNYSAVYPETAVAAASADPTFVIDEPGYSAYTIEGVPAGPAATAAPEPATWAMMLIGFAGLGYAGYRRKLCATSRAVGVFRA
jgi:hypothetical protein